MVKATGDRYGISGGLAPLKVVVPAFSTKTIQQSTPVSGASNNEMTVTLRANYDLTTGGSSDATVTITGLAGSETDGSAILVSTCASNSLGTSGSWDQNTGTLILTVGTTVAANTDCAITFTLTNPTSDLTSPDVSVEAALTDGSSSIGSIASAAMVKATGDRYGISGGLAPLKVVVPAFTQAGSIQQSTPVAGDTGNVITVTLTSNYVLKTGTGAAAAKVTTGEAEFCVPVSPEMVTLAAAPSLPVSSL